MKTKTVLATLLALAIILSGCATQNQESATGFATLEGADSGLVAWYKFDEGSGTTAADSSGNGNNATLVNSPAWIAGKIGSGALSFDGTNKYASVSSPIFNTYPVTVCAWVNPTLKQNGATQNIVRNLGFSVDMLESDGKERFSIYNNSKSLITSYSGSYSAGVWHHVCGIADSSSNATIYVNGILAAGPYNIGTPASFSNVSIGGSSWFKGFIDEVRIYSRTLDSSEIALLFGAGSTADVSAPSVPTGLVTTDVQVTQATISWTASTDNTAVTGYRIFRGGAQVATSASTSFTDTGLLASTTYTYTVSAYDAAGNISAQSAPLTVTTQNAPIDTLTPVISSISAEVTSNSATISWNTNEPADSELEYGPSVPYANSALSSAPVTSHSQTITGLTPNTLYHYRVKSKDAAGNQAISGDFTFTTAISDSPTAGFIPEDRRTSWRKGIDVGVVGGIPNRTTICANVKNAPYNAVGDGITNDTNAIVQAIQACGGKGQVVYFPEGTYKFTEMIVNPTTGRTSLNFTYNNTTFRGAGMGKTILKLYTYNPIYVGNGDWPLASPTITITGGAVRGSRTVSVSSTAGITVGKLITITQKNPSWVHYNSNFYNTGPVDDGHDFNRLMAFTVKVTGKDATSVTFEHPLPIDMTNSPMITAWNYIVSGTGFEDMTFDLTDSTASSAVTWNQAYGCWIKGVEIKNPSNRFLWFTTAANCEVRDSYLHDARILKKEGLDLYENDCFFLIENNTLVRGGNPMIILGDFGGGVCNNVVAYNYLLDQQPISTDPLNVASYALSDNHGPHNIFNLFESNIAQNFASDGYYGSASHTTLFRNRFNGVYDRTKFIEEYAINLAHWATSYNLYGNVLGMGGGYSTIYKATGKEYLKGVIYKLGYPNCCNYGFGSTEANPTNPNSFDTNVEATAIFHGNFDYATNSVIWDPTISERTLPSSLYLTSKPAWFGSLAFPAIGPDVSGYASKIPAQLCYEQGKSPTCLISADTPLDGQCGASNNACTAGMLLDVADSTTQYLWACLGVLGGADANCSLTRANVPPTVTLTSPANNATFISPANIALTAQASDSDGTITRVEFYNGSARIATDSTAPYTFTWNNVADGNYTLSAKAYDDDNSNATSAQIKITVTDLIGIDTDNDGVDNALDRCPKTKSGIPRIFINQYGCPVPIATKFDIKPDFNATDINEMQTLELGITQIGKISYTNQNITLTKIVTSQTGNEDDQLNIDADLNITTGKIEINTNQLPMLNKPATITLYNITATNPQIKKDGIICTQCTIISHDKQSGTLVFTVPGF